MFPRKNLARVTLLAFCLLLPALILVEAAGIRIVPPAEKLLAADGSDDHNFGRALALDGQTAVIGAPSWDNNGNSRQGAVYIFTRGTDGWVERARLGEEDGGIGDGFGGAVALDAETLAVGVFGKNRPSPNFATDVGSVVVYTGAGSTWTEQATLMPADLIASNFFGMSVALDDSTLIAGAPTFFSAQNQAAYVFARTGTTWSQQGKLTAPGDPVDRGFGRAVALSGNVALVGAPGTTQPPLTRGTVYIFTRNGSTWSPAGSIAPDDSEDGDHFGCAIDYDGQTAVIGACEAYGVTPGPGKAYVFVRTGNTWRQEAKLIAEADGLPLDVDDVTLHGERIVLGSSDAPKAVGEWSGAAFVYERQGAEWGLDRTLYAADAQTEDSFGRAVALSADALLVGAPDKNYLNNSKQGAVYAFKPEEEVERAEKAYLPVVVKPANPGDPVDPIIYVDKVGSEFDIFAIDPGGGGKTNLTQSTTGEYWPRWSPDRTQIAFARIEPSSITRLWIMNSDGSGQRIVPTPDIDMLGWPDWSPDGQKLVFAAYTNNAGWDIYAVGVDGSRLTNLTADLPGEASDPSWSPDGTHIVFRHRPDKMDLVVMDADGRGKRNLTDSAFSESYPHWSPDGASILFFGGQGSTPSLFVLPATGGEPRLLIESAMNGRWSADGDNVVFTGSGGGIFQADSNGGNLKPVDESPTADLADW